MAAFFLSVIKIIPKRNISYNCQTVVLAFALREAILKASIYLPPKHRLEPFVWEFVAQPPRLGEVSTTQLYGFRKA